MGAEKGCPSNKTQIGDFLKLFFPFCLRCCTWAFFNCSEWGGAGATLHCVQTSHCSGFSGCGAQDLGPRASAVVA